jgi:hypothetical protein
MLKAVNPAAVKNVNTLYTSPEIPYSPLCSFGKVPEQKVKGVMRIFRQLPRDRDGRKALRLMNYDKWVEIPPEVMKRLK